MPKTLQKESLIIILLVRRNIRVSLFLKAQKVQTFLYFLDTHVSLAPTHVSPSVRKSYFRISILLASLVALCEKLKKVDHKYFLNFGYEKDFMKLESVSSESVFLRNVPDLRVF